MNLTVLDGFCLNPGDLSWEGLEALGNLTVYDRTDAKDILSRAEDSEMIFTNKTPLTAEVIERLPNLRYIGVLATGYNVVDIKACDKQGIVVANVPDYGTAAVAQFIFALLLAYCHRVEQHSAAVKAGRWCKCADYSFHDTPQILLAGKTFGVIGFGKIGRAVSKLALAFGMKVKVYSRSKKAPIEDADFCFADFDEVLKESDVLSLCCSLTPESTGMIDDAAIDKMKESAVLINTSRGAVLDDTAVANALHDKKIDYLLADVLSEEPPRPSNYLLCTENTIITPHIAWAADDARRELMRVAAENAKAFLEGKSINTVGKIK